MSPAAKRPSLLHRVRPFTASGEPSSGPQLVRPGTGVFVSPHNGDYKEPVSHPGHHEPGPVESGAFLPLPQPIDPRGFELPPKTSRKRQHSKSFSGLRHGVGGLRSVVRRLSLSVKHHHKISKQHSAAAMAQTEGDMDQIMRENEMYGEDMKSPWYQSRPVVHQPSFNSLNGVGWGPSHFVPQPIPGYGTEPPILPDDLSSGAAARAAAAAQNEQIRLDRKASKIDYQSFRDDLPIKPSFDSESGIEISIQDATDSEDEVDIVRKDPANILPAEIMAQILSFLDADSLKQAELVSRTWYAQASSHHVWRDVFYREFRRRKMPLEATYGKPQSMGLGKALPNRDWKKMYAVRRALEKRWKNGKAAAIYLHGHKDSVYCVQFDEKKIITGSRDRTIRVWDAHFPWPCVKVIGAPHDPAAPVQAPTMVPSSDSPGASPFISICPPARPAIDLMTRDPEHDIHHSASILCLQYDDEIMVTGSSDSTCIVWDMRNDYKPICRLRGHTAGVLDVCFNDKYILSCSKDTNICIWDRHTRELLRTLTDHRGPVNAVQLRGDLAVSASGDGAAKLWDLKTFTCIKEFSSRDRGLACIEFSEDARTILAGGNDQVIYQFDAKTGELVKEYKGHTGLVRSLHLDNVNGRIVSGSYDQSVKVFDTESGELSIDLPGWTTSWMLSAKSDYRRIVATSQDARAVIMDFGYGLDGIDLLEE
ncbi:hypothetical protein VTO42DRAFT_3633 [Malbranchea cinnamomea]